MRPPAIVIQAYNRTDTLSRLLNSVSKASFPDAQIPLLISIDKSDNAEIARIAEAFEWPHGPKQIINHDSHLGLVAHTLKILHSADAYDSLIILEDDLMVSPQFYKYASEALDFYKNDPHVAAVSLYNYCVSESSLLSFIPIDDGSDVYFMQYPSSWGFCISKTHCNNFLQAYHSGMLNSTSGDPAHVQQWSAQSWKKLMIRYLIQSKLYFVYPQLSLATNFSPPGTNTPYTLGIFQVPLRIRPKTHKFTAFSDSGSVYDSCFEITPACLNAYTGQFAAYNYVVDIQGVRDLKHTDATHILTSRKARNPLMTFSNALKPLIANVINNMRGNEINFAAIQNVSKKNRAIHYGHSEFIYKYRHQGISGKSSVFRYFYYLIFIEIRMYLRKIFR